MRVGWGGNRVEGRAGGADWGTRRRIEEGNKNMGQITYSRERLKYLPSDCVEFLPAHALSALEVRVGAPPVAGGNRAQKPGWLRLTGRMGGLSGWGCPGSHRTSGGQWGHCDRLPAGQVSSRTGWRATGLWDRQAVDFVAPLRSSRDRA